MAVEDRNNTYGFDEYIRHGEQHDLKNRYCHIGWREDNHTSTIQAPNKHHTSNRTSLTHLRDKYRVGMGMV